MNYNKRLTFFILFFFTLLINAAMYIFLGDRPSYSPAAFEDINSRFPSHLKVSKYEENGWRGIAAANKSRSKWVYMLKKPHEAGKRIEAHINPGTRVRRLRIDDNTYFGLVVQGKNYRRYIYVFVLQDNEYWIESGCSYSPFLSIKKMADTILEFLTINGSRPFQNIKEITGKTTRFVSPRYSQSIGFLMVIITGSMFFSIITVFIVFYFSGLPPAQIPGGLVKEISHASLRITISNWWNQHTDGYIASSGSGIVIYLFKKLKATVPFAELVKPRQVKVAKTWLFKQDYISFSFSNTASVFPKRKSPVKKVKITLYLKHEQIRKLLLNTRFPFKDQLF